MKRGAILNPTRLLRVALAALVLALAARAGAADFAAGGPGLTLSDLGSLRQKTPDPVHAALIADVDSIEAGRPFRLGVLFTIDPGWHIYWRNSGDAGIPTEIAWQLPPGFTTGPLQWPLPRRFEQGDAANLIVSYGFEREVLLFAEIAPPPTRPNGPLVFRAQADWLMCQENCIPGKAALELTLSPGAAKPSTRSDTFMTYAMLVPKPLDRETGGLIAATWKPDPVALAPAQETTLTIQITPREPWRLATGKGQNAPVHIFPIVPEDWEATHPRIASETTTQARFAWPLKPRPQAKPGPARFELILRAALEQPATGEKKLIAAILTPPAQVIAAGQAIPPAGASAPALSRAGKTPPNSAAGPSEGLSFLASVPPGHSIWLYLLYAFFGGMILNVMPCVLPVLSIKVLSFVRQSGENPRRIFRLGLTFACGVLVSFALLGGILIALKSVGSQAGWGFQLQEPRFVIVMSAVVLAFGLSLFGVFSIDLPGSAMAGFEGLGRREGYGGAFYNGVLATALATPCTAPLLGSAMGFAFSQPDGIIMLFFLTAGLGLATPYVALSAQPGWLKFLPRPGAWMETFKQLMGFLLLATLVWLLGVVGSQIGSDGVMWTLAFLLTVGLACWLIGRGFDLRAGATRRRLSALAAVALVAGGYGFFPERYMDGFHGGEGPAKTAAATLTGDTGVAWQPFSVDRVEALLNSGQNVFVDFSADWCVTCKFNEKTVLDTPRVEAAFRRYGVAPVKADWTLRDAAIGKVLAQLGRGGVPVYVIFRADRPQTPIILPTLITPGLVEEQLREAATGATLAEGNTNSFGLDGREGTSRKE